MVSLGIAAAAATGRPVRPWLIACAAADLADVTATLIDADGLPDNADRATVAVAGGTALAGLVLAALTE